MTRLNTLGKDDGFRARVLVPSVNGMADTAFANSSANSVAAGFSHDKYDYIYGKMRGRGKERSAGPV